MAIPINQKFTTEPENLISTAEVDAAQVQTTIDFLTTVWNEWIQSPQYKMMLSGQKYFENKTDVLDRERFVIGKSGEMVKAAYLANNKLPHAFMRKMTKQKIGYLLSKPFTVTSDNDEFQKLLANYFDSNFFRMFKNGGKDAVINGMGWLQVYYDETGALKFKRLPATEIKAFWADIDHTILDKAIRVYDEVKWIGAEKKIFKRMKFFTKEGTYNYIDTGDGWKVDEENPMEMHFQIKRDQVVTEEVDGAPVERVASVAEDVLWERIPLIPLKYNSEEDSLLMYIKPLIDDYDKRSSDVSNTLEDEPNKIKIVKNYDGTDKGEFVYNLAKYRTLFLRENGEVSTLDTTIDNTAVEAHLTRLRKDIYEFGGGVDTQNKDLGNASGVALKFVYADLDSDCSDFGLELAWAIEQLCWYIKIDLQLKNQGDFIDANVEVAFNTDITINESETIQNIANSVGIVSNKTLLEQHPYVTDAVAEEEQIKKEQQENLERVQAELEMTNQANQATTANTSSAGTNQTN